VFTVTRAMNNNSACVLLLTCVVRVVVFLSVVPSAIAAAGALLFGMDRSVFCVSFMISCDEYADVSARL